MPVIQEALDRASEPAAELSNLVFEVLKRRPGASNCFPALVSY